MAVSILPVAFFLVLTAQLALRYCRALIWSASKSRLSTGVSELLDKRDANVDEFAWASSLLKLCPPLERPQPAVPSFLRLYRGLLKLLRAPLCSLSPHLCEWVHREQAACSHFAALLLDQRIALTREFYERHFGNGNPSCG